jgi:hypothetical protein
MAAKITVEKAKFKGKWQYLHRSPTAEEGPLASTYLCRWPGQRGQVQLKKREYAASIKWGKYNVQVLL